LPEEVEDAFVPEGELRSLEEKSNKLLREYCKLYFGSDCTTSAYFFETTDTGFGACFLIKN
jgi:hypothetical protein